MFIIKPMSLGVLACTFSITLLGSSLKDNIVEVLNTNPIVQERLKNFRATQQDLNIAESEYYPQLDLKASGGWTDAGELKDTPIANESKYDHNVKDEAYTSYQTSLTLTQNIFDGFGTMHKVDYQEARILAAAYNYVEKSNDMAFKMVSSYTNVLKAHALILTAIENVQINETIYKKVQDLFDSGLTTDSEVKKIQSALSLARSNLTVEKNNAKEAEYTYRRILGRMPVFSEMEKPKLDVKMPQSIEKAAMYAIENNPSLLVGRYDIKSAQALWKQQKKDYYPKVDVELAQNFNDVNHRNSFDSPDDRFTAKVILNYNLFRGGSDKANIQKHLSKIAQEVEIRRDLKRQVIEGLDLSWSAYEMVFKQLVDLREYSKFSEETLSLYEEEYDLGRRSLLDLLSAQNDVINSRSQIISAEYDQLFAKYRILDAMGLLVIATVGDTKEYTSKVNLYDGDDAIEILDTVPISLDVDNDKIPDNLDLCDNSLLENNIMPYGCKKTMSDEDGDGVSDFKDSCPLTPKDIKVLPTGCSDSDGVKDSEDSCLNTPIGHNVDISGCSVGLSLSVDFAENSAEIPVSAETKIDDFAKYLQENRSFDALIIGHTDNEGSEEANRVLSQERANSIEKALELKGIDVDRLNSIGRGEIEPIATNDSAEGKQINRRVEIKLSKKSEEI